MWGIPPSLLGTDVEESSDSGMPKEEIHKQTNAFLLEKWENVPKHKWFTQEEDQACTPDCSTLSRKKRVVDTKGKDHIRAATPKQAVP